MSMLANVAIAHMTEACRLPDDTYLDDDGIASKDCCREGIEDIVERVVPRHNGAHLHYMQAFNFLLG